MYSTIYIYETNFQKSIIDVIIRENLFDNNNSLIIDARNHAIVIDGLHYNLNFNKIKKLTTSLKNLDSFLQNKLSCNTLVSTHFVGINSLFFSSSISAEKKILIDDGIGTPIILQDNNFRRRQIKYQLRFLMIFMILSYNRIKLLNIKKCIKSIDEYLTVYDKIPEIKKFTIKIKKIDFFNSKINSNQSKPCFIGAPMIEFKILKKNTFIKKIKSIQEKIGPFVYYLHPDETISANLEIHNVEFTKLPNNLEAHFEKNGVPNIVIGFVSSVLLNLAQNKETIKHTQLFYIKSKVYGKKIDNAYYKFLEANEIVEFPFVKIKM